MANQKQNQIQLQFKLNDVREVQFVKLCNEWPKEEMQVGNQINFSSDTENRLVRCLLNVEYKLNDITQLILAVETVFEFERMSWSALYHLNEDEWILPVGLLHHMADMTFGAARGILAVRCDDNRIPRVMLPIVDPRQFMKADLRLKRNGPMQVPASPQGEA